MQDNESVLLAAEGNNGNIELTEALLKINEYKKGFMGYDKSKISKVHEIPRDVITEARVSEKEFYVFVPEGFPDVDPCGYFTISIDVVGGYWQGFKDIAEEIGLQGYWYEDNSKLSHIESYESEEQASIEAERAAKKRWRAQSTSTTAPRIFFGSSRPKGKITITYERTPEWLASNNKAVSQPSALAPQPTDDPLQKMKQLKGMLDAGLITESEYNAKKDDLLSRM